MVRHLGSVDIGVYLNIYLYIIIGDTVNCTRWNVYGKSVPSQTYTMNIISDNISPKEFGKFLVKILGDLVPRPNICNKSKYTFFLLSATDTE